jgi:3-dehydroquinate synthase
MTPLVQQVSLGERSYPIELGENVLATSDRLKALIAGRQVAVITDTNVGALYAAALEASIRPDAAALVRVTLPAGETTKDWMHLNRIFDALLEAQFDRRCVLIALGGGVIGDITGFAAALYQRGVDFVQVPTTLLAQVDSSVGGKTAINHPLGKNMIGAFHQPRLVIADMAVLRTLPGREVSAGLAEIIKHGAIADVDYLQTIEQSMERLRAKDAASLMSAVAGSCAIKAAVVSQDEKEAGLRAILNFGHTFGHAIEAGLGYGQWLHGEAVGAGMVFAADLSVRLGLLHHDELSRLCNAIASAGLPTAGPAWSAQVYVDHMAIDKKADQGIPKFVVLEGLGCAKVQRADAAVVRETLQANATLEL